jgi:hypothetical protein
MLRYFLACAVFSGAAAPAVAAQAGARPIAVERVTVIPMSGEGPRSGQTVLIRDGRIEAVGPTGSIGIPGKALRVDGRGKFVIPGLWDMHVHTSREGRARYFWPLFLAHGVTGVREMGSYLDTLQHWRAALRRQPHAGPRIIWSSPMLDGSPAAWRHGIPLATPEAGRTMVDSMQALGFDFIKVYSRLPKEIYEAISAEARRIGMPFAGHVPASITPAEASAAGQRSIEHQSGIYVSCVPGAAEERASIRAAARAGAPPDSTASRQARLRARLTSGYDSALCGRLFETFRGNGTWQTPTLVVIRGAAQQGDSAMAADPRRPHMPAELTARWDRDGAERDARDGPEIVAFYKALFRREVELAGAMHRAGVRILVGTDASDEPNVYPGSSVHDELELLVSAGLSPADALAAATVGPAEYLGLRDSLGTVEAGRAADLVILDADPLADIRNIRRVYAVVSQGRLIDPAARQALLESARAAAARARPAAPAAQ